jgi:hypothetical protein
VGIIDNNTWPGFAVLATALEKELESHGATAIRLVAEPNRGIRPSAEQFDAFGAASDVIVGGLGACGSCTSGLIFDTVQTAASAGKPGLAVVTEAFESLSRMVMAPMDGDIDLMVMPRDFRSLPPEEVEARTDEDVPRLISMLQAALAVDGDADAAASVLGAEDVAGARAGRSSDRLATADGDGSEEELAYARGWSDGLPVVLPTQSRLMAMMATVDRKPDEVIGKIPPLLGEATVEKVAANAVMAGCRPEYFPVVLAAVDALLDRKLNILKINTTTNPVALMTVVNGPVRDQIAMNYSTGCLGPGNRANATIGRTISLINRNIGGSIPGVGTMSTQASPGRYTLCFAENEELSPWDPYHVDTGLSADDSAVTLFAVTGTASTSDQAVSADSLLGTLAAALSWSGSMLIRYAEGVQVLVLNPHHAGVLAAAGLSKEDVKGELVERTNRFPLDRLGPRDRNEVLTEGRDIDGAVPSIPSTDNLAILVAGGPGALQATFASAYVNCLPPTRRIS